MSNGQAADVVAAILGCNIKIFTFMAVIETNQNEVDAVKNIQ